MQLHLPLYTCSIPNDADEYKCAAMDYGGVDNAKCMVCPGRCHWKNHVNRPYRIEDYQEEEERTIEYLKKWYEKAMEGKATKENMIKTMEGQLQFMYD